MQFKIFIIFILHLLSNQVIAQDSLIYSTTQKLVWENFRGKPIKNDSVGARISHTIQMKIDTVNEQTGIITFSAWAIMYPEKSWVKPRYKDNYTLNPEQLHFDIAELIANKLEWHINQEKIDVTNDKIISEIN